MWPFKKRRQIPFAEDLTPAEHAWLRQQRESLAQQLKAAAIKPRPGTRPLDPCDDLIRAWHAAPVPQRPDANALVLAVGVALGDALAKELGLEWKIITDAFGTDMGLWHVPASGKAGNIILSPTHSVAKQFADNPDGFVVLLFDKMVPQVRDLKRQLAD